MRYCLMHMALTAPALLIASLVAGCADLQVSGTNVEYSHERAQIESRLKAIIAACERKNFAELDSYHLYGPRFSKFSAASPERQEAEASRKGEHTGLSAASNLNMRVDDLKVDVFGDASVATFILSYSFDSAGTTTTAKDRTTMVFVHDAGDWKIAHEHLSPIRP